MIPKTIHYCWFGGKKLPKEISFCMDSWKRHLPDYKIIKWDEANCDIHSVPFTSSAYKNKKYAFVSDYFRLKALNENGGIYFDTDMLILRSLDNLLKHKTFIGYEDDSLINAAILGAEKNNNFLKDCLLVYENSTFDVNKPISIPHIITSILKSYKQEHNSKNIETINDVTVYPFDFFYPLPFKESFKKKFQIDDYITNNSYAVHLWNNSWFVPNEYEYFNVGNFKKGISISLKKILRNPFQSKSFYMNIAHIIKKELTK